MHRINSLKMNKSKVTRYWRIEGYAGTDRKFETVIPEGALSEAEVKRLLQRLASRHLSDEEVVSASLRKNVRDYQPHLEIHKNTGGSYALMTTGTDYYYVVTIR
jgi:hypothetical protein